LLRRATLPVIRNCGELFIILPDADSRTHIKAA